MNWRELFLTQDSERAVRHTVYLFEGFQLDVTRRKLVSSGGLVQPLNSRAMEALLLLVANAGELIEKRRLMQTVWPTAIVEDNNLNQCILAIRKALGETAGSNRYVMTVPGRGYRFVCPVRELEQESPSITAPPTPVNRALSSAVALRWSLVATVCTVLAALMALRFSANPGSPAPAALQTSPADPGQSSIILRLRTPAGFATGPAAADSTILARCLAAHPGMKLQIVVRLVSDRGAPLWTGDFTAGAQDVISLQTADSTQRHDCRDLPATGYGNRGTSRSR